MAGLGSEKSLKIQVIAPSRLPPQQSRVLIRSAIADITTLSPSPAQTSPAPPNTAHPDPSPFPCPARGVGTRRASGTSFPARRTILRGWCGECISCRCWKTGSGSKNRVRVQISYLMPPHPETSQFIPFHPALVASGKRISWAVSGGSVSSASKISKVSYPRNLAVSTTLAKMATFSDPVALRVPRQTLRKRGQENGVPGNEFRIKEFRT